MISVLLFDRDGTLVEDRPPMRDPSDIALMPTVARGLALARARGVRVGVVTNQPNISDGSVSLEELKLVNARIEALAGQIDRWFVCPHAESAGCGCRKPQPGLLLEASRVFNVPRAACAVVGDIESDLRAARAAGMRAVLVPTPLTRSSEVRRAHAVAPTVLAAVRQILAVAA